MPVRARWLSLGLASSFPLLGCFAGGSDGAGIDDDYMDDPPPPGDCVTDCPEPGSDGSPVGGPCLDSDDCAGAAFCAAEFDGEVQGFTCREACIEPMDDTQWCADDQACCPGTTCTSRGFCVPAGDTEALDDSGSADGSGTTDATGTGSGTTDATGTGSGSGTTDTTDGSSTGTSTGTG